jgi:histidinol-phosphate/aromatic aminotransferase/cobyric acid decarboxylase-like protein
VRPVANYRLPEYLRVTLGTIEQNDRFLSTWRKVLIA